MLGATENLLAAIILLGLFSHNDMAAPVCEWTLICIYAVVRHVFMQRNIFIFI